MRKVVEVKRVVEKWEIWEEEEEANKLVSKKFH